MKGHIKKRGDRYYAVIYEGLDPVTGKERRTWHPAGTHRVEAEKLAAVETKRIGAARSLTLGAYLTSQWLPAKKLQLATSIYRGYERNVQLHILPVLGRISIRRLRYQQIESLFDALLHPAEGRGLNWVEMRGGDPVEPRRQPFELLRLANSRTCWKVGRFVVRMVSGIRPGWKPVRLAGLRHTLGSVPCWADNCSPTW
ncbi:MAG: hypothetical protein ABIP03_11980 [Aquihabitans sp.]